MYLTRNKNMNVVCFQLVESAKTAMFLPRRTGPHWRTVSRMRRASTLPRKQPGSWSKIYQVNSNMCLINSLCKVMQKLTCVRILLLGSKRRVSPESLLREFCERVGPCAKTTRNLKILVRLFFFDKYKSSCTGDLYSTVNDPRPQ